MATDRPAPRTKSRGKPSPADVPPNKPTTRPHAARSRRDDTPEAKDQRGRVSKTHPTRAAGAARKDSETKHPRG